MPRQPRLDAPGLLHHIIARGIERRPIFTDREDYDDFLTRLPVALEKSRNQVLAWTLMPNHFHLLIRSGNGGVVDLMRRLMTGYAGTFNRRHRRAGHLFQNRYKSIVCEEDSYLKPSTGKPFVLKGFGSANCREGGRGGQDAFLKRANGADLPGKVHADLCGHPIFG
jgi:REP element-mobilizing transposase RayT